MMKQIACAVALTAVMTGTAFAQAGTGVLKNTTISASGQSVTLNVAGVQSVGIRVDNPGTYTLAFEASMDGGVTYVSVGTVDNSDYTNDTGTTGPGSWLFANTGWSHLRVRASAYTSGTPIVRLVRGYGGITAPLSAGSVSGSNSAAGATGSAVPASGSYNALNIGGTLTGQTGFSVGSARPGAVAIVDGSGNQITSFGGGTQYTHDAALTIGTSIGTIPVGRASAAAPTDVSADNDAVAPWYLRSGAQAMQVTFGGVLATTGNGASGTGVQRVTIANDSTGILAGVTTVSTVTNVATIGTSVTPGTAAGNLGKAEDAVHASGDTGVAVLAVRNDAGTTLAGTTGDYAPLSLDANGALRVSGSAGTTQYAEDIAHTTGDSMVAVGVIRRDTTPSSSAGTAGDYTALNADANGRLYTQAVLYSSAGSELTLANDVVEDAAETAGVSGPMVLSVRRDTAASSAGAAGDNATVNTDSLGRLWVRPGNPCEDHARVQTAAISNSTSGNVEVVALNGSDLIYVCGYSLMAGAATGVRFVYGTGTACATGETGLTGAWPFAANGGIQQPNTGAPQFVVPAGNAFCTENTGANAIAGHVTYVRTAAP